VNYNGLVGRGEMTDLKREEEAIVGREANSAQKEKSQRERTRGNKKEGKHGRGKEVLLEQYREATGKPEMDGNARNEVAAALILDTNGDGSYLRKGFHKGPSEKGN